MSALTPSESITPLLSERVRVPGIIGTILGGMLIGPHGFHLIEAGDRMEFLSTIGHTILRIFQNNKT